MDTLSNYHKHDRDAFIQFTEEGHKYTITSDPDHKYTSVTTWIHTFFKAFDADKVIQNMMSYKSWKPGHKYWGLTPEEIKRMWSTNGSLKAKLGTDLHLKIEEFHNQPDLPKGYSNKDLYDHYQRTSKPEQTDTLEWNYFLEFIQDNPKLKPYRAEWCVYDEDSKLAGSIDMVYMCDNCFYIYDWKRCDSIPRVNDYNDFGLNPIICHLPDSKFWHYSLQLNTYQYILQKNYGMKIKKLCLVRLHPDAEEKTYEVIELPDLQEEVRELMEERIRNL